MYNGTLVLGYAGAIAAGAALGTAIGSAINCINRWAMSEENERIRRAVLEKAASRQKDAADEKHAWAKWLFWILVLLSAIFLMFWVRHAR